MIGSLRLTLLVLLVATITTGKDRVWADEPTQEEREKALVETLSGATLVGSYTGAGPDQKQERYVIHSMEKVPGPTDTWIVTSQIQYGDRNLKVPVPLQVKWAGDTPVLTLTETSIPLLGTFTARVMIFDNHYTGYWRHDNVRGHLFGKIEKNAPAAQPE
jgi:hypothetical protein